MKVGEASLMRLTLAGGGGEPVDLVRTLASHGVASLPPFFPDGTNGTLTATLAVDGGARTVEIRRAGRGAISVAAAGGGLVDEAAIAAAVRHVLRLDADLSDFYGMATHDPQLSWVVSGAGRMMRCQTVFEDVIKTICTTNCTWSATERMVDALVGHLGRRAPGSPAEGTAGRAFPGAEAMAEAGEDFYRDVARAGYRGAYLRSIAESVASGRLDLDVLDAGHPAELPDDEVEARLLALPGVGPYAAAHIMMMLGRYSRLILDSWTRPTYARVVGRKRVADRTIVRRFKPYGPYAGLAFWLFVTRDWVED